MTWDFVEGHLIVKELKEGRGNNRSVMPLDALGRTRATMLYSECEWFCCLPEIRKKGIQKLNTEVVQERKFLGK